MFINEDTALSVTEHMKNALWLISATIATSPVIDSSPEEQRAYNKAISKICDAIIKDILDPIRNNHPNLSASTTFWYQGYLNKKRPESGSESESDTVTPKYENGSTITFKDRQLAMQVRDLVRDIGHLAHRARHIANEGNWTEKERVKFKNRLCLGIDDSTAQTLADIYRDHHDLVPEDQRINFPPKWFDHPESE